MFLTLTRTTATLHEDNRPGSYPVVYDGPVNDPVLRRYHPHVVVHGNGTPESTLQGAAVLRSEDRAWGAVSEIERFGGEATAIKVVRD